MKVLFNLILIVIFTFSVSIANAHNIPTCGNMDTIIQNIVGKNLSTHVKKGDKPLAVVEETCAYDKQMCTADPNSPMARLTNNLGMLGDALKEVLGEDGWIYEDNLYPRLEVPNIEQPLYIRTAGFVAASPIFLQINSDSDFDTYENIRYCFKVSNKNGVQWRSTDGKVEINNEMGIVILLEKGWDTLVAYIIVDANSGEPTEISKYVPINITEIDNECMISPLHLELLSEPDTAGITMGSGYYAENTKVNIAAGPQKSNYYFKHWEDNLGIIISEKSSDTITLVSDSVLIAVFEKKYNLQLSVEPEGTGSVTGANKYDENSNVTITATPSDCYYFRYWKNELEDTISKSAEYEFTLTSDSSLIAVFARIEYHVTINAEPTYMGEVTGASTGSYNCDRELNLKAIGSDTLYTVLYWTSDDINEILSYDNELTVVVRSDTTIIAHFSDVGILEEDIYDINIIPNPTENDFSIIFENTDEQRISIELLDISGAKILDIFEGFAPAEKLIYKVEKKLASGSYIVKFMIGNKLAVRKVVVK